MIYFRLLFPFLKVPSDDVFTGTFLYVVAAFSVSQRVFVSNSMEVSAFLTLWKGTKINGMVLLFSWFALFLKIVVLRHPLRIQWNVRVCNSSSSYRLRHIRFTRRKTDDFTNHHTNLMFNPQWCCEWWNFWDRKLFGKGKRDSGVVKVIAYELWFLKNLICTTRKISIDLISLWLRNYVDPNVKKLANPGANRESFLCYKKKTVKWKFACAVQTL